MKSDQLSRLDDYKLHQYRKRNDAISGHSLRMSTNQIRKNVERTFSIGFFTEKPEIISKYQKQPNQRMESKIYDVNGTRRVHKTIEKTRIDNRKRRI
ncbi:21514_t:CDS:2 [Rhizophagus irregularis]|nr:21514_t:CDS:2 [Rhizophagus irregularis]